jgi:hypothetical protein
MEADDQSFVSTDLTEDQGIEPNPKHSRLDHSDVSPSPLETAISQYGPPLGPQAPNPPASLRIDRVLYQRTTDTNVIRPILRNLTVRERRVFQQPTGTRQPAMRPIR